MSVIPDIDTWRAEGLRLRRQPLAWIALGALLLALLTAALSAGFEARAWRQAAAEDGARRTALITAAVEQFRSLPPGPGAAQATYQLGRGELGATRMPVGDGLALGVDRLRVLPAQLKATLDSRHVDARPAGPLRNPLLTDSGLPGLPSMVALLLPLVALALCAGLLQEEREQGRLGLLRVQARRGMTPVIVAALGWRFIALWGVTLLATLPALLLDPGSQQASAATAATATATSTAPAEAAMPASAAGHWALALAVFCGVWVLLGGLLSALPLSGPAAMLAALGLWVMLSFVVPAGLIWGAQRESPMPSRLAAIVQIRQAQQDSETHEDALARDWYLRHPTVSAQLPAAWPASFVPRVLAQDRVLRPLMRRFDDARLRQAAWVERWSWLSPGLALTLTSERLAGTDAASHVRYLRKVDAFEDRWRDALIPQVMDRRGISAEDLAALPRFAGSSTEKDKPSLDL
ncbi:DUF3526 domain-containing protein [Mitsuaria sp. 7]|uniref:DUF3526 domain-containing protein n=1 Tax=Mitsuaria sp. 7 TaxID=1658665 RepID=UPI0007DE1FC2|nr:DUF3526 domain-containing protein [Mitsuaria sp. 7]ANH67633.1 hypothetical protein ABE85_08740 [Mitsuaria sp. 7]